MIPIRIHEYVARFASERTASDVVGVAFEHNGACYYFAPSWRGPVRMEGVDALERLKATPGWSEVIALAKPLRDPYRVYRSAAVRFSPQAAASDRQAAQDPPDRPSSAALAEADVQQEFSEARAYILRILEHQPSAVSQGALARAATGGPLDEQALKFVKGRRGSQGNIETDARGMVAAAWAQFPDVGHFADHDLPPREVIARSENGRLRVTLRPMGGPEDPIVLIVRRETNVPRLEVGTRVEVKLLGESIDETHEVILDRRTEDSNEVWGRVELGSLRDVIARVGDRVALVAVITALPPSVTQRNQA